MEYEFEMQAPEALNPYDGLERLTQCVIQELPKGVKSSIINLMELEMQILKAYLDASLVAQKRVLSEAEAKTRKNSIKKIK